MYLMYLMYLRIEHPDAPAALDAVRRMADRVRGIMRGVVDADTDTGTAADTADGGGC